MLQGLEYSYEYAVVILQDLEEQKHTKYKINGTVVAMLWSWLCRLFYI